MKKIISVICFISMVVLLVACGGNNLNNVNDTQEVSDNTQAGSDITDEMEEEDSNSNELPIIGLEKET